MIHLNYKIKGSGNPIILLHGFPFDHHIWETVGDLLSLYVKVITPDLRGHGSSPVPEPPYSMRGMAEDVVGLMDSLSIERAVLVGHSMGGYVCMEIARSFPERLLGLGLVATNSTADSFEKRQSRLDSVEEIKKNGAQSLVEKMAAQLTEESKLQPVLRDMMMKTPVAGIIGAQLAMAERPDSTNALKNVLVPALVIGGERDQFVSTLATEKMTENLRHGRLVKIPNAGHMPMMDNPLMVANALLDLADQVHR